MPYVDIIILALIAGFVALRLRAVLGQKTGFEGRPAMPEPRRTENEPPVVRTAEPLKPRDEKDAETLALEAVADESARAALAAMRVQDAGFSLPHFVSGAQMAFEMVFDAFTKGDRDTLTLLLAEPLAAEFLQALDARASGETHSETTLLAVREAKIVGAQKEKNTARIRMRFVSEQVTVVRNRQGAIVEGNPATSHHVEDEWVFERDLTSKNPNWKIIET